MGVDDKSPELPMNYENNRKASEGKLSEFLSGSHKTTKVVIKEKPEEGPKPFISHPWGDASISICVSNDDQRIFDILNKIHLPERLSAVYHKESRRLEVMWTSYKLLGAHKDVVGRKFVVLFDNVEHECIFSDSSTELMEIAKRTYVSTNPLQTNFRNMMSFIAFSRPHSETDLSGRMGTPVSFFIENVDWDDTKTIDMINHLNFYMKYYDPSSPTVLVFQAPEDMLEGSNRYIRGDFPIHITMHKLDGIMLNLWGAGIGTLSNEASQYVAYYRIMEYAAAHSLSEAVKERLRRIIRSPRLHGDIDKVLDSLSSALLDAPHKDDDKVKEVIKKFVDVKELISRIQINRDAFFKDTNFEGGFEIEKMVEPRTSSIEDPSSFISDLVKRMMALRNVLSHGRDRRTKGVILLTPQNMIKLRPWVSVAGFISGDVLIMNGDAPERFQDDFA